MASKKTLIKGKKDTIGRLMDLAKKGNDLWNEYGDVVKKGVASIVKKGASSQPGEEREGSFLANFHLIFHQ